LFVSLCSAALGQTHVKWSASRAGGTAAEPVYDLHAKIDKGWHLYSIVPVKGEGPVPTTITVDPPLRLSGPVTESKPITKLDPNFNLVVQFFQDSADFKVPVKGDAGSLKVRFQLCNDSTCIPPSTETVPTSGAASSSSAASASPPSGTDAYTASVQTARSDGLLAFLGLSFVAGLLSLLTPCVFPMIPITVSFFAKRRSSDSGGVLGQAAAYCLGIIGSFAGFGMLVSVFFGASGIQKFATNPWVNLVLAAIFIVLALALLGIYTINLPAGLVNRFSGAQGKGGLIAAALMGLTFTLTSFTCTVPFVGTILAGASQGDYVYPLLGMIAYGTAFASPFFLLALFPQYLSKLPKSGSWLETVKAFMGFVEVAAAIKFLSNADLVLRTGLLPRPRFLGVWASIAVAAGLFLLSAYRLPGMERPAKLGPWRIGFGAASVALAVWFVTALGGRSLGELEAFMPPSESGWLHDYTRALQTARLTNRPILINFTGVTCTNCRWMEKNMFPRSEVASQLGRYITVELYTDRETSDDAANKVLQQKLTGVVTLPEYVALTPEGQKVLVFQGSTRDTGKFVSFLRSGRGTPVARR
jgi:thiol:disulfide interchange protein DsbD